MDYLYEVLIRGNQDGTLKGAHQVRMEVFAEGVERIGQPEPLDRAAVGKLLGDAFPALLTDPIVEDGAVIESLNQELVTTRARIAELEKAVNLSRTTKAF